MPSSSREANLDNRSIFGDVPMNTIRVTATLLLLLLMAQQKAPAQELGYDITWNSVRLASFQEDVPAEIQLVGHCATEGCEDLCCCPSLCCVPTCRVFGELLYLRARDAEVVYGVPIDGAIVPPGVAPIQVGPLGMVDPDFEPAFRVGIAHAVDACAELAAVYTHFESNTTNHIADSPTSVIRSMVLHPGSAAAATDFLDARAAHDIDFQLVDLEYRRVFSCGPRHSMSYLAGVRYANLNQDFMAQFAELGTETMRTGIEFDGGGLRVGWEGERHARSCGLMIYGRATANFVAGEFKARYAQGNAFDPVVVDTRWQAGRIVTMIDLELGVGWASPCDRYRFTTGYVVNSWFNTVKTSDWINAVQTNDFDGLGDKLTFDGLVVRTEVRF